MSHDPARTLDEAQRTLDVKPLEFFGASDIATNPAFYVPLETGVPAPAKGTGLLNRLPMDRIRRALREGDPRTKVFLSGHVGSGKSTEIDKLMIDKELNQKYWPIRIRFEEQEVPYLDAVQLLFHMAARIYEEADKAGYLDHGGAWKKVLLDLNAQIYGATGIEAKEGALSAEFNLIFLKVKEELKLSEKRRKQFHDFNETQQSVLKRLLEELAADAASGLKKKHGQSKSLLLFIDDLDKARGVLQQTDIFETNLPLLFVPPFPVLYTVPLAVAFGSLSRTAHQLLFHLYPRRVLDKYSTSFNPEDAFISDSERFFHEALAARASLSLFEPGVLKLAVVYSGGVLREFFRLLGSAVSVARDAGLDAVTEDAMLTTIKEERLRESMGLYTKDWDTLLHIHQRHELKEEADRKLLDLSRVLECFNDVTFFEVNPLLWAPLEGRATNG